MMNISIVTATRAEYGLLYPLLIELRKFESDRLKIELIVTGTHLSDEYGMTVHDIERDAVRIDEVVEIPVVSETRLSIALNQAETLAKFATLFDKKKYDAVVLLGDRYETLMFATAAYDLHIPIVHLYGGDTTEGALDEGIRHSITKMSFLHFATNEISRQRIIQMGEMPERVFNYGATGTDNIVKLEKMTKFEALQSVGLEDCRYGLCTYHPVTLEDGDIRRKILDFLDALSRFPDIEFIVTKSNADHGGSAINALLEERAKEQENVHIYSSLGMKRYLSLMSYAEAVVGNSSSGIMEAPSFGVPTVNIGSRQKGRLRAASTIDCDEGTDSIAHAIELALSTEMKNRSKGVESPYGDGHAGERIAREIIMELSHPVDLRKSFYDLKFA